MENAFKIRVNKKAVFKMETQNENQSQACQELATLKLYIVAAPGCPNRLPPCFETRRSSD